MTEIRADWLYLAAKGCIILVFPSLGVAATDVGTADTEVTVEATAVVTTAVVTAVVTDAGTAAATGNRRQ